MAFNTKNLHLYQTLERAVLLQNKGFYRQKTHNSDKCSGQMSDCNVRLLPLISQSCLFCRKCGLKADFADSLVWWVRIAKSEKNEKNPENPKFTTIDNGKGTDTIWPFTFFCVHRQHAFGLADFGSSLVRESSRWCLFCTGKPFSARF